MEKNIGIYRKYRNSGSPEVLGQPDRRALRYEGVRASVTLCDKGGQNWTKKALRNS